METRNEYNEKRRRKMIQKNPVLVRSAKPGQSSTQVWERASSSTSIVWKFNLPAA